MCDHLRRLCAYWDRMLLCEFELLDVAFPFGSGLSLVLSDMPQNNCVGISRTTATVLGFAEISAV